MTSISMYITNNSDAEYTARKERDFTYAYHRLYNDMLNKDFKNKKEKSEYLKNLQEKYDYADIEFRSLESKVKGQITSQITIKKQKEERIEDLKELLYEKSYDNKHTAFKKRKQLNQLISKLDAPVFFGDISILKKISKECNKPKEERDVMLLNNLHKQLEESRNMGFFIMGEGNQKCNRFVDLSHLTEGKIILKIDKEHKVELLFSINQYANWIPEFQLIEKEAKRKQGEGSVPVSFLMKGDFVTLSFEPEKLNGYGVDERSRRKDVQKIKAERYPEAIETEKIKECYKKYYREQEELKLENKLENVAIAIDMNPNYIGYAVIRMFYDDFSGEYEYEVLKCGFFDVTELNRNKGYASNSKKFKRLTNKRHYELSIIAKKLMGICRHYKCYKFILEDLDFKHDDLDKATKEANRQRKNIWCRNYLTRFIKRRCDETGTQIVEICAVLSSFIGNIQHCYADPVNAAIEIARRGVLQYQVNTFYPHMTAEDISTMRTLFGDGFCMTGMTWKEAYNSAKSEFEKFADFSHRWRRCLTESETHYVKHSMDSWRSLVCHYEYDNSKRRRTLILQ